MEYIGFSIFIIEMIRVLKIDKGNLDCNIFFFNLKLFYVVLVQLHYLLQTLFYFLNTVGPQISERKITGCMSLRTILFGNRFFKH